MTKQLDVLTRIAKDFNKANITWMLGGSLMLYLRGIVDNFEDVDILLDEKDIEKAKKIMNNLGTLKDTYKNDSFKTKFFYEYIVNDLKVDLMAGFIIVSNNKDYYFPLTTKSILDTIVVNNTVVYLDLLTNWLKYYRLMKRHDKVEIIESYINNKI